ALGGIGHRVVHGGDRLTEPTLIDAGAIAAIADQAPLAPLHNPSNLLGIRIALASFPDTPQVAGGGNPPPPPSMAPPPPMSPARRPSPWAARPPRSTWSPSPWATGPARPPSRAT